jgi:glycosyltransferase involved in cell wall biosynthesis
MFVTAGKYRQVSPDCFAGNRNGDSAGICEAFIKYFIPQITIFAIMFVFGLFVCAIVIQWFYASFFFKRIFTLSKSAQQPNHQPAGVSIIICAKNEATNLLKHLPAILSQKYNGPYEVIVINDASGDDTPAVLQDLALTHGNLKIVSSSPSDERILKGKKHALSIGAAAASYDWLLLTDADCQPAGDQWLELMTAPLSQGKEIVAGYGEYEKTGGLLNAFIRWETMHSFLQYSTYALAGNPYMAVGRNMACTKSALLKAQASDIWNELPSGDDDLLVSICGNKHNVAVVSDPLAFTYTEAKATWREWAGQKQRHLSTGKYYKANIKLLLGLYGVSHAIIWAGFFILLCSPFWTMACALLAARCLTYWLIWMNTCMKLKEKSLVYLFPLFDIGWMIYNFAFFPYITWKNKNHWT